MIGLWCNGSTTDFDSVSLGSKPGNPTFKKLKPFTTKDFSFLNFIPLSFSVSINLCYFFLCPFSLNLYCCFYHYHLNNQGGYTGSFTWMLCGSMVGSLTRAATLAPFGWMLCGSIAGSLTRAATLAPLDGNFADHWPDHIPGRLHWLLWMDALPIIGRITYQGGYIGSFGWKLCRSLAGSINRAATLAPLHGCFADQLPDH